MYSVVLVVAAGILAIIAYHDIRTRRIPNALSFTVAMLGLTRIGLGANVVAGGYTLAAATLTLAATFVMFRCGTIGGGDAKMIPATALLVGYQELLVFLFLMSICGGALALVTISMEKLESPLKRLWIPQNTSTVPYGFAIAAAGVITLVTAR